MLKTILDGATARVKSVKAEAIAAINDTFNELFAALKTRRENWKTLQPNKPFPGVVILQIDQETKAVVVKSVFQTAAYAGYPNVSFMVNKGGKGG